MIILLEGVDGSGKTTLYRELQKEFNYNFIKGLPRDDNGHYLWWKKKIESPYIYFIDRGFISEWVYRPIKDDAEPNISLEEIGNLCSRNLLVLWCNNKNGYKNILERGDDYINNKKEYDMIVNRYIQVITTINWFTNSCIYEYDYEKDSLEELLKYIKDFICRRKKEWSGQQIK